MCSLRERTAVALGLALAAAGMLASISQPRGESPDQPAPAVIQERSEGRVRLTLAADRQSMPIDGRVRLTLTVEAPNRASVALPEIGATLGPFVVAGQNASGPTAGSGDSALWRRDYVLEAERVGELVVPPLVVAIEDQTAPERGDQQLATEPLADTVTSVLPQDAELGEPKDIAPPVALPGAGGRWWPWLLAVAAIGIALLAGLAWRRRRRPPVPPAPAPRPAHVLALAELERLQAAAAAGALSDELYPRLAEVLRRYLVGRFDLSATARTTEELLGAVRQSDGPIAPRGHLIGPVLAICDLVKFARHRPRPSDAEISLRQTREFIEQTADEPAVSGRLAAAPRS